MNALSLEKTVTKKSCRIIGRCRNTGELYVRADSQVCLSSLICANLRALRSNFQNKTQEHIGQHRLLLSLACL
jgi:hypothetical protein